MKDFLIVSDNAMAKQLKNQLALLFNAKVMLFDDFGSGLTYIVEKRPLFVCLQDTVAGDSAIDVTRHIKLILGSDAPGFILLHEHPLPASLDQGQFLSAVDISVPVEDAAKRISELLQEQGYNGPSNIQQEVQTAVKPVPAEIHSDFLCEDPLRGNEEIAILQQPWPTLDNLVEPTPDSREQSDAEHLFMQEELGGPPAEFHAAVSSGSDIAGMSSSEADINSTDETGGLYSNTEPKPRQSDLKGRHSADKSPAAVGTVQRLQKAVQEKEATDEQAPAVVHEMLGALEKDYKARRSTLVDRILLLAGLAVIVASLIGVVLYFKRIQVDVDKSGATYAGPPVQQAPKAQAPESTIPSFVPTDRLDSAFSLSNPGWSRYLSDAYEYRIFKENGKLRALQVIAGRGHEISSAELSLFLQEMFGKEQLLTEGTIKKNSLFIENATVAEKAKIQIYRLEKAGPIKALAVSLD